MAGRRYEWINWDGLGNEAEEDAADLNYDYEWVVPDQDEDVAESSHRRWGGRLGLAGGVRGRDVGLGRGNAGRSGLGRGGAGGSGLGQRVRSVVNQAMVGGNGEGGGREDDGHARGSGDHARGGRRLGLAGSRRGPNPVTRWPVDRPTVEAQENGGVGDSEEHVEQEADNNVEGDGNGGASGKL
ncbi:glycine-rich cell wall structural protein 1.8 [Triticum aestivum]|uniref:glycine-rich cell wall structural protein 1.8 n=1 Tax=Triticum aestivum TaxID=4565 RepID=UPI001D01D036|nr:glycine-rich cell wall structural protein 1.8-like [Triticum aestivum]XP_045087346.1 glycine-rich cell wall structural protein 1.8 [Aegilops tauschii subsp. strangulata]